MKKAFEIRLKNMSHPSGHRNVMIDSKKFIGITIHWRHFRLSKEELAVVETDPYISIIEKKKPMQMELEIPVTEPEPEKPKAKKKKSGKKKPKR